MTIIPQKPKNRTLKGNTLLGDINVNKNYLETEMNHN